MKFLCPQCKAKYQIADDKIDGRTLRMKCRRCEHEIVVKGDVAVAESEPPPPAAKPTSARTSTGSRPAAGPSAGARRPAGAALAAPAANPASRAPAPRGAGSALGADFRRQMRAGATAPSRPPRRRRSRVARRHPRGARRPDEARRAGAQDRGQRRLVSRSAGARLRRLASASRRRRALAAAAPLAAPPPPTTRPSAQGSPRTAGRATAGSSGTPEGRGARRGREQGSVLRLRARAVRPRLRGRTSSRSAGAVVRPPRPCTTSSRTTSTPSRR